MELFKQGAEAKIFKTLFEGKKAILKSRVPKAYRCKTLDEMLRTTRTTRETSLLQKARSLGINTPTIYDINKKKKEITMELVEGQRLKDALEKKNIQLCKKAGETIAKMHEANIVHGDLTTSNIIVKEKDRGQKAGLPKEKELYFIDFGLGKSTAKHEDKAVDLLVFKKTFEATHIELMPRGWELIIEGYLAKGGKKEVLKQMQKVEERVRYH